MEKAHGAKGGSKNLQNKRSDWPLEHLYYPQRENRANTTTREFSSKKPVLSLLVAHAD
jgi:hypothetical protein